MNIKTQDTTSQPLGWRLERNKIRRVGKAVEKKWSPCVGGHVKWLWLLWKQHGNLSFDPVIPLLGNAQKNQKQELKHPSSQQQYSQ